MEITIITIFLAEFDREDGGTDEDVDQNIKNRQ